MSMAALSSSYSVSPSPSHPSSSSCTSSSSSSAAAAAILDTTRWTFLSRSLRGASSKLRPPTNGNNDEGILLLRSTSLRSKIHAVSTHKPFRCVVASNDDVPTVSDTKSAFLTKFRKPIPSIYNNVIQELIVQQHLMRYNRTYKYDAVFALGFVTVYDQLMDGYPTLQDREAIFNAYIEALKEDPEAYRNDAKKLEEWASSKTSETIVSFASGDGEVECILKEISQRAAEGNFHYSRFFAIGLFRLLERANATDPSVLEKLSKELNVSKLSIDRDLDVYRNLLSKLVQAKELLKEYIDREKKKQAEREAKSKPSEAVAKMVSIDL